MSKQLFDFTAAVKRKTQKAFLLHDGAMEIWMPRSQMVVPGYDDLEELEVGDIVTVMIEEWLAEKKCLI